MIALFVFSIIAVITAQVLHRSIKVKNTLQQEQRDLDKKTKAIVLIKRDLSHAVDYIGLDNNAAGSMIGDSQKVNFNQISQKVVNNNAIPVLARTIISYQDGNLTEQVTYYDHQTKKILFKNISEFNINYQDCNGQNFSDWQITPDTEEQHDRNLPCRVTLSFMLNDKIVSIKAPIIGDDID